VVVRAKKIGAAAFLAKPIDSDLLLEQIDQIISR
jgi:FixJ family two-component response regulator